MPEAATAAWVAGVDRPESVTVTGARAAGGETGAVRYVHNYAWEPASIVVPVDSEDLLADRDDDGVRPVIPAGTRVELGPWDVRVLREVAGD